MKRILTFAAAAFCSLSLFAQASVYDIVVKDATGADVSLSRYQGKVLLIVNTATRCGFTPQYKELQQLYDQYAADGLEILDFPCNQFGEQAPGSMQEIKAFCTEKYHTTFPQFLKVDVNGDQAEPLWKYLYARKGFEGVGKGLSAKAMEGMMKKRTRTMRPSPKSSGISRNSSWTAAVR